MIPSAGEGAFPRFWLPLIILGILVVVLFPRFGARDDRTAREAWDGVVVLVSFDAPPEEPLHLLATLPLAGGTNREVTERLVIGDVRIAAGGSSAPLLLSTPRGNALGERLTLRVDREAASLERIRPTYVLHRAADIPRTRATLVGAFLRGGTLVTEEGTTPLPAAMLEIPDEIRVDDVHRRRWPGSPSSFGTDWARFQEIDPGGLAAFIHARRTLPAGGPDTTERSGIGVPAQD